MVDGSYNTWKVTPAALADCLRATFVQTFDCQSDIESVLPLPTHLLSDILRGDEYRCGAFKADQVLIQQNVISKMSRWTSTWMRTWQFVYYTVSRKREILFGNCPLLCFGSVRQAIYEEANENGDNAQLCHQACCSVWINNDCFTTVQ